MADEGQKSSTEQLGEDIGRQLKIDAKDLLASSDALAEYSRQVNNFFTQGRQRITELSTAIADAVPSVRRLGGDIGNVADIMGKVAAESRRNVIANTEDVEKLYAAQKVLGLGADTLTKAFLDVGRGIETIPETLEESVQYIQSIGGNAKTVMGDVTQNMEQMNRYQFEGGVLGLTKMAAQASMLRFDMNETFRLSDRVLSPEGAIETAAAFQRLGVAAGNLADPFALMNASINDPGSLQDSLVDVAKQFTYFDEKTKTFKINPQGVLTLKEMEQQTGVSAKEMSKLGLAAAEADMRISAIGSAGLNIKEDDKQYLANIAKMGEGGEYEVKLRDESGIEQTRKLSEITQDEFDKLIKEQREGPKTMEDLARAQMNTSDIIKSDVAAIRAKIVGGVVSAGQALETREGIRRGVTTLSGGLSEMGTAKDVRQEVEKGIGDLGTLVSDLKDKNMSTTTALSNYLEKAGAQLGNIEDKFKNSLTKTAEEIRKNTGDKTAVERLMKQGYDYILGKVDESAKTQRPTGYTSASSLIEGSKSQQIQQEIKGIATGQGGNQKSQVEMMGGIKIDINFNGAAADLTPSQKEQITKMFTEKMNSLNMKQYMYGSTTKQNPIKSDSQYNYS
jgi:hypothetical protein